MNPQDEGKQVKGERTGWSKLGEHRSSINNDDDHEEAEEETTTHGRRLLAEVPE
jgi:hypothetical protein